MSGKSLKVDTSQITASRDVCFKLTCNAGGGVFSAENHSMGAIASHFRPSKVTKCFENGLFEIKLASKMG